MAGQTLVVLLCGGDKRTQSRETLYRTLSASGNPRLDTLSALLHAMGLRLSAAPTSAVAAR